MTLGTSEILLDNCYKRIEHIVSRRIAGEAILVPIQKKLVDLNSVFALNETAASAWELLDGQHTLKSVLDQLVTEYDVEKEQAHQDLLELIQQFIEIGIVEKV